MDDDNLFDDDDALDYIFYEESNKNNVPENRNGGCLSVVLVFIIPSLVILRFLPEIVR